jgi:phage minor structural protein
MIPILYEQDENSFTSLGIGKLTDAQICHDVEERNGSYELELKYPVKGIHFSDIAMRRIILAKPNYIDDVQPFRIYKISKPLSGIITVNAHHLIYDLLGYVCGPFSTNGIQQAMAMLISKSLTPCPFILTTTRSTQSAYSVSVPTCIRSLMGGNAGSLLDVFGGEWHYDKFTASLENDRGSDRGVVIRYGKDLVDLKQEENCANVYTGVVSYWKGQSGSVVSGNVVNVPGTFPFTRILSIDASADFQTDPTIIQLDAYSNKYITENDVGKPKISITLSFDPSTNKAIGNSVNLCDTVSVYFSSYGIDQKAKCIKYDWDVLHERYITVDIGEAKSDFASSVLDIKKTADSAVTDNTMSNAMAYAAKLITGNLGGCARVIDTDGDGMPDEFVVSDDPDLTKAKLVGRWNKEGIGFSTEGYSPEKFNVAATNDGHFNANFITIGIMNAALIKVGVIRDKTGVNYWDLDNGIFHMGLSEYFTIQPDGSVLIGNETASMKLVMSANKISFYDNGVEVAYITNKELFIASAQFFQALNIKYGANSSGYYQFHVRQNEHLSLNYITN